MSRSQPGAERQAEDLRGAGHEVVVAPVIAVEPVAAAVPAGGFQAVIFVSEHAVECGLPLLRPCAWFPDAEVLAVGGRTAEVLAAAGISAEAPAEPISEGLLALPALASPEGLRILLVAGEGGRGLLAEELACRGAEPSRLACYRRVPVESLPAGVLSCDAVIAASGDGLRAVSAGWFAAGGSAAVPVLVPSARVARLGVELGFSNLHDCRGADSRAWLGKLAQLQSAMS